MNDSSNGVLTVQPLDATGKPDLSVIEGHRRLQPHVQRRPRAGTLGQFIPAVPLASFISKAPGAASILALQQIAQTDTFHTNLGLVEATGKSASVLVSVFNGAGNKVLDLPVTLAAGEQRQLNGFLATNGITLTNGHIEVASTGGDGKVTAYASVIDNRTTDPLLVSGVPLGGPGATRYRHPRRGQPRHRRDVAQRRPHLQQQHVAADDDADALPDRQPLGQRDANASPSSPAK